MSFGHARTNEALIVSVVFLLCEPDKLGSVQRQSHLMKF